MGEDFKAVSVRVHGPNGYNCYADWFKCKGKSYPQYTFIGVLRAERDLRALVQCKERLQIKLSRLDKDEQTNAQLLEEELESLPREIFVKEYALYEEEAKLDVQPLKEMYDPLRRNPRWYCRPELVEDCISRGGCCSRSCGCCESRHFRSSSKGVGHCTIECGCCTDYRGFEITSKEREEISEKLHRMEDSNLAYLARMTEAYFSKPKQRETKRAALKRLWRKITS